MSSGFFTARIRWQADTDPAWELETSHGGFVSPEQAALFANAFADIAADELRLVSGRLPMTLTDGTTLELEPGAVQVWRLPENGEEPRVADDADFQRVSMSTSFLRLALMAGSSRSSTACSIQRGMG